MAFFKTNTKQDIPVGDFKEIVLSGTSYTSSFNNARDHGGSNRTIINIPMNKAYSVVTKLTKTTRSKIKINDIFHERIGTFNDIFDAGTLTITMYSSGTYIDDDQPGTLEYEITIRME